MIYSVHTFELSLILDTKKFNKQLEKAYRNSKNSHRLYQNKNIHHDYVFTENGIKIEYHDNTYKKKIKFIVNPTKVLGGDDVKKLWKPNDSNISNLLSKLNKYIDDYFNSKYRLDDFKLSRIDFTVNMNVGDKKSVSAYIKILHKLGKVKGFAPKYDKNDDHIDKNNSFDLEGNSNGVEFTAYDKEAQSKRKKAIGILRVEVRLKKHKTVCKYTDETITSKQIKSLTLNSRDIFLDTFTHIVPYGNYYKKKEAVKIIEDNITKKNQKEKMLRLIELIPKKKSLHLAQKEMKDRNIEKIMDMFAEINLSPVTISKSHNVKELKNLYSFLID